MLVELYVVKGREAGKALELVPGSSVSFGRSLSNDVRIRDAQVSRVHCRLDCTETALLLTDLSGNGTFVNDERVEPKARDVAVADGDRLRLGSSEIRVLIETGEEADELLLLERKRLARRETPSESVSALSDTSVDEGKPVVPVSPRLRERRGDTGTIEAIDEVSDPLEQESVEGVDLGAYEEDESRGGGLAVPGDDPVGPARSPSAPRVRARRADDPGEQALILQMKRGGNVLEPPSLHAEEPPSPGEPAPPSLREVIPGYRIEAKLGGGGRRGTVVYRALQLSLDRPVALKVLHPHGAARERDLGRFLREAAAVARLPHPNVVTIHDAGRAGERRYIVMELLCGGSAADLLEDGPFSLEQALALGIDVARGLGFAHARGIIHRTVRPDNVLRDQAGTWKLVDFGLARDEVRGGSGETTFLDAPVSTVAYLSPEQLESAAGDARSDVYATGALLYHAVAGRPPFRGGSIAEVAAAIARGAGEWDALEPAGALASVVRCCLERDPGLRYPDGQTLLHELVAVRAGAPSTSGRVRAAPRPGR